MKQFKKIMPPISALLCAICLILLLLDAIQPAWSLFLKDPVKWFLLILSFAVIAGNGAIIARERRRQRRRKRK